MAKINLLNDRKVTSLKRGSKPGLYADGGNLYLRLTETGAKSWIFRFSAGGKIKQLGLGSFSARSLKAAREVAADMRAALANGEDPATVLKPKHDPSAMTFKAYAEKYIKELEGSLRNGKQRNAKAVAQWPSTLEKWVYPHIGSKRPSEITYGEVKAVLTQPALAKLPETQKRVRQRIKVVLDEAAKEEHEPHRYNPALAFKLDTRDPESIRHHAAAPYQDVPAIMDKLRLKRATSAMLLRFSVLTCARSMEARGAVWSEINLDEKAWTLAPERMKGRKRHVVPLPDEAVEILDIMAERKHPDAPERVFPGERGGLLSDVAINKTLRSAYPDKVPLPNGELAHVTAHGMRSSFRMWAANQPSFSREAVELCLAHKLGSKVEHAYQRDDLLDLRRHILAAWANYLAGGNAGSNVAPINEAKTG